MSSKLQLKLYVFVPVPQSHRISARIVGSLFLARIVVSLYFCPYHILLYFGTYRSLTVLQHAPQSDCISASTAV